MEARDDLRNSNSGKSDSELQILELVKTSHRDRRVASLVTIISTGVQQILEELADDPALTPIKDNISSLQLQLNSLDGFVSEDIQDLFKQVGDADGYIDMDNPIGGRVAKTEAKIQKIIAHLNGLVRYINKELPTNDKLAEIITGYSNRLFDLEKKLEDFETAQATAKTRLNKPKTPFRFLDFKSYKRAKLVLGAGIVIALGFTASSFHKFGMDDQKFANSTASPKIENTQDMATGKPQTPVSEQADDIKSPAKIENILKEIPELRGSGIIIIEPAQSDPSKMQITLNFENKDFNNRNSHSFIFKEIVAVLNKNQIAVVGKPKSSAPKVNKIVLKIQVPDKSG